MLRLPDGRTEKIKVRSMVGLIALCANSVFPADTLTKLPNFAARGQWFTKNHPELLTNIHRPGLPGTGGRFLLALTDDNKLRQILTKMLDENEFLSPYGIRSISRTYADHPYSINIIGTRLWNRLSTSRIQHWSIRRKFQLARTNMVPNKRANNSEPS